MRHLLCLSVLALAGGAGGCAQTSFTWQPVSTLTRPLAAQYPDAPAVVLFEETHLTNDVPLRIEASHVEEHHRAIRILTRAGFEYGTVRIHLGSKGELRYLHARTIGPNGEVREVQPEEVLAEAHRAGREGKHQRSETKVFHFPGLEVGSTLEYAFAIATPHPLWAWSERIGGELPILRYRFQLDASPTVGFAVKTYLFRADPHRTEDANGVHAWLELTDLPARPNERFALPWQLSQPWVAYRTTAIQYSRFIAHGYKSWDDVAEVIGRELYDAELTNGAPRLPVTDGLPLSTLLAQALELARRHAPLAEFDDAPLRKVKEVLERGRASNLDKALLLYGTLKAAGVHPSFALAGRYEGLFFDPEFPVPEHYDHLLLYLPADEGGPLWLDPSCEACRPGELPDWSNHRTALVVHHRLNLVGREYKSELLPIEAAGQPVSTVERSYELTLAPSGDVSGRETVTRHGRAATIVAIETRTSDEDKLRRELQSDLRERLPSAQVTSAEHACDRARGECRTTIGFSAAGYASVDGDGDGGRLVVPLSVLAPLDREQADEKPRVGDLSVGHDAVETESVTLRLPSGWTVDQLPQPLALRSPALDVSLTVEQRGDAVVLRRTRATHTGVFPKESWPATAAVLHAIEDIRHKLIALRRAP